MAKHWTPEEDKVLLDSLSKGMLFRQVKQLFPGRSVRALQHRNHVLKKRKGKSGEKAKPWTSYEDAVIRDSIDKKMTPLEVWHLLPDRTMKAIHGRRHLYGAGKVKRPGGKALGWGACAGHFEGATYANHMKHASDALLFRLNQYVRKANRAGVKNA